MCICIINAETPGYLYFYCDYMCIQIFLGSKMNKDNYLFF